MNEPGWQTKFEFTYKDGKPFLRVLDPTVKRVTTPIVEEKPIVQRKEEVVEVINTVSEPVVSSQRLGVVFIETPGKYPGFNVELVSGEFDQENMEFLGKVEHIDLSKYVPTTELVTEDISLMNAVRKLQRSEPFS